MKTILSLALTAVFPCALVCAGGGQTEIDASDSEVQEESTSLDKSDEEALSEYRTQYLNLQKKSEEVEKKYEAIESPPRSLSRVHARVTEIVTECMRDIEKTTEDQQKQLEERATKLESEFVFSVVPQDQRMKYIQEGKSALKEAARLLNGNTETQQVDGMNLFMKVREVYQGVADYARVKKNAEETLAKLTKRWSHSKGKLSKAREKLSTVAGQKVDQADARGMEKVEQSMKEAGNDADKQLFVPSVNNLLMLEKVCEVARTVSKTLDRETSDKQGATEQVLSDCWQKTDQICDEMQKGRLAEAESLLNNSSEISAARSLQTPYIDPAERDKLNEQIQVLRAELRERTRFASKKDNLIRRNTYTLERALGSMERQLEKLETEIEEFSAEQREKARAKEAEENAGDDSTRNGDAASEDDVDPDETEDSEKGSRQEEDTDEDDEE